MDEKEYSILYEKKWFSWNPQRLHHLSQISQGGEVGEKLCIYLFLFLSFYILYPHFHTSRLKPFFVCIFTPLFV